MSSAILLCSVVCMHVLIQRLQMHARLLFSAQHFVLNKMQKVVADGRTDRRMDIIFSTIKCPNKPQNAEDESLRKMQWP